MNRRIKIVADKAVPFLEGLFEPYADIDFYDGSEIRREHLLDADAMIIRTRTRCTRELLDGTRVQVIATATIGTDHIDLEWCAAHGITVVSAPGCNAGGVMGYVFSAVYGVGSRYGLRLDAPVMTFGIVGAGHVGEKVAHMAEYLGFKVLKCDPPRASVEGAEDFVSLDELLAESDIVSLHVPLDGTTRRMADDDFFAKMRSGAFFLNTSRGDVLDEEALLRAHEKLGPIIIDTWQNEPNINRKLLEVTSIATPHIAGYSYQGKQNGTASAVRAIARHYDIQGLYHFFPSSDIPEHQPLRLDLRGMNQGEIAAVLQYNYPIFSDDFMLRTMPENFERLRSEYSFRREIYVD